MAGASPVGKGTSPSGCGCKRGVAGCATEKFSLLAARLAHFSLQEAFLRVISESAVCVPAVFEPVVFKEACAWPVSSWGCAQ